MFFTRSQSAWPTLRIFGISALKTFPRHSSNHCKFKRDIEQCLIQGRRLKLLAAGQVPLPGRVNVRTFRTSIERKALPPIIIAILRPVAKLGAIIFGRSFRRWWQNLPPEKRKEYLDRLHKNRLKLAIGGGVGVSLVILYYFTHVERNPLTNRRRYISITRAQFKEICDLQSQMLLSQFRSHLLPDNDYRVLLVKRVARRLFYGNTDLPVLKDYKWAVHVVDAKLPNVFVTPNGHIFVFTGMLQNFENEDQLGIVLGHEMAHAVLLHGLEQTSWAHFTDSLMTILLAIIWAIAPPLGAAFSTWITYQMMTILTHLPYSRVLENEADDFGLHMAAKACFDPREVYAFWIATMMKGKIEGTPEIPSFLSSHPTHGDRASRLEPIIEDAIKLREQYKCPPLKPLDPRVLADAKKRMIEQELEYRGSFL